MHLLSGQSQAGAQQWPSLLGVLAGFQEVDCMEVDVRLCLSKASRKHHMRRPGAPSGGSLYIMQCTVFQSSRDLEGTRKIYEAFDISCSASELKWLTCTAAGALRLAQ
jgi:hypothetical protein